MWIRTDLAPDTDQIGTLRFDAGGGVVYDIPIYATGASSASVEEAARMQVSATAGFIPVVDFADLTPTFDELRMQHNTTQYGLHDVATIPAVFDVTITNTNSPVTKGETLSVDYSANNTGDDQDTQDIRLEIDSVEEDQDSNITLNGGVSTTGTLSWDTTNETAADYSATVLSNDDSDSVTVTVESKPFPASGITRLRFEQDYTDSWGGNDGSATGTSFTTNSFEGSYALNFDGSNDVVTLGLPSNLDFTASDPFSVSTVVNPDGGSGGLAMTRKYPGGDSNTPFIIFRKNKGVVDFIINDNVTQVAAAGSISNGSYQRFTATYSGSGDLTLYKGSSQVDSASGSLSGDLINRASGWHVGGDGAGGSYDGKIDVTDWYDKELSSTEVSNLDSTGSIDG